MFIASRENGVTDAVHGTNVYMASGDNSHYFASSTYVVPVIGNRTYTFGCRVWMSTGSFLGNSFTCFASYICT
jgi:hypothetical protein